MGTVLGVLGLGAAGYALSCLVERFLVEAGIVSARDNALRIPSSTPLARVLLLRTALLLCVTLCGWQFIGEDFKLLTLLLEWRGADGSALLLACNVLCSLGAVFALQAYLRYLGLGAEADNALLAMSIAPFAALGNISGADGIVLLLLVLSYICAHRGRAFGVLFALAAQLLDIRAIVLLPVFLLMTRRKPLSCALYILMALLFFAQAWRGGLASAMRRPIPALGSVVGYYLPAALCVLGCVAYSGLSRSRYADLQITPLLICGGILPFVFGAPMMQFALPLGIALQKNRYPRLGLLLLAVINALYIGMGVFRPGVWMQ